MRIAKKLRSDVKLARSAWGELGPFSLQSLLQLLRKYHLSIASGDLLLIDSHWYITHAGLLGLAVRNRCIGIEVQPVKEFCDPRASRYVFCAIVRTSPECKGFVGFGDADPSNVSPLVRGAEMRVAETRAVNRALRKAYGIGICSVEEIGSVETRSSRERPVRKLPPESCNGSNGHGGNGNGMLVRDRLCQLIRQHKLDAVLVKAYAVDFCGTKTLREASREQIEAFVVHLADLAAKDHNALLCQLNSYQRPQEHMTSPQAGAA
jgi:hypothetical protein